MTPPFNSSAVSNYAIITGGSSGIGYELARQLLARGCSVCLVGRRPELLRQAEMQLEINRPDVAFIDLLPADVSDEQQIKQVLLQEVEQRGVPDYLFNFAGIALPGEFLHLTADDFRRVMQINFFGTVYPTQVIAPLMAGQHVGHIINCASVAGFVGLYGYAAYGASKFAVRGFSDTLRVEMKLQGVKVSIVFPPDTQTPQLDEENKTKPAITRIISSQSKILSAETVAKAVLEGIDQHHYLILPGSETRFMFWLNNTLGHNVYSLIDKMVANADRALKKQQKN